LTGRRTGSPGTATRRCSGTPGGTGSQPGTIAGTTHLLSCISLPSWFLVHSQELLLVRLTYFCSLSSPPGSQPGTVAGTTHLLLLSLLPTGSQQRTTYSRAHFVNHLRIPGVDSQPCGLIRQPYLSYRSARLYRLAESIPGLHKRLRAQVRHTHFPLFPLISPLPPPSLAPFILYVFYNVHVPVFINPMLSRS
jgi:hypothetical protein